MKRKSEFIACEQCVERLARHSTSLVSVWFAIIGYYIRLRRPFVLIDRFDVDIDLQSQISRLEKLGYIISTEEAMNRCQIIPRGHFYEPTSPIPDLFCIDPKRHGVPVWDYDRSRNDFDEI